MKIMNTMNTMNSRSIMNMIRTMGTTIIAMNMRNTMNTMSTMSYVALRFIVSTLITSKILMHSYSASFERSLYAQLIVDKLHKR